MDFDDWFDLKTWTMPVDSPRSVDVRADLASLRIPVLSFEFGIGRADVMLIARTMPISTAARRLRLVLRLHNPDEQKDALARLAVVFTNARQRPWLETRSTTVKREWQTIDWDLAGFDPADVARCDQTLLKITTNIDEGALWCRQAMWV